MNINEAKEVLNDYKKGNATPDQAKMVENWYMAISREQELNSDEANFSDVEDIIWEAVLKRTGLDIEQPKHRIVWPRIIAAASIVICVGIGFYFFQKSQITPSEITAKNDIAPGGNKAVLTLADGKRIVLTDAKNGALAEQSGVKISKAGDGQLVYTASNLSNNNDKVRESNIIETPNGGQYQIILPDGTKVWLNAASSLKFPSTFARLVNRQVELLRGEAYFEVAKDKKHPFIVRTDQQEVEVLGTHFNINSYGDEPGIKTTLVEGSIKVRTGALSRLIKPNQQSNVTKKDITITEINIQDAIAWKNGLFAFDDEPIESVMNKIARWYNVEIEIQSKSTNQVFTGTISKFENVSKVLEILELTGVVHFEVKGRRIIITE